MSIDIYCHTNRFNGMRYVGYSSQGIEKRWLKHVALATKGETTLLLCAIREFGHEASKKELYATERGLEIRQRTSLTMTGVKPSEEHKRNAILGRLGYKHSAEARRKLSEAAKRREARRRNSDG